MLERTTSGNVTVNDTLSHYVQDDLPFGGVGASGMGAYHGPEGFKTLSHAKGIYTQARVNVAAGIRPPFGRIFDILSLFTLRQKEAAQEPDRLALSLAKRLSRLRFIHRPQFS